MSARTRRPPRGCLVALMATLVAVLGLAVVVRRALDPHSLKALAEGHLGETLGQPVTIGTIYISWLPTPSVEARDIVLGAAAQQTPPSISLRATRIKPRLSSLLSRPITVDRVELIGVTVAALRDREGNLVLPLGGLPPGGQQGGHGTSAGNRFEVAEIVLRDGRLTVTDERSPGGAASGSPGERCCSIQDIQATVRKQGAINMIETLSAAIGGSTLEGSGSSGPEGIRLSIAMSSLRPEDLAEAFGLVGAPAPEGISIEGDKPLTLDVALDPAGALSASGRVAARSASFRTFALASLDAPVRLAADRLTLDPVTFTAYAGTQRGRIDVDLADTPVSWTLETNIERVDMRQLVNANTSARNSLSGTGRMRGRLQGNMAGPILERARGAVSVALADGAIHNFPVVAAVNTALRVAAGDERDLRYETLSATLAVAGGNARTEDLVLTSGDLTLTAAGRLGFDQSLDFRGRVVFSPEKSARLIRSVKELSRLANAKGQIEAPLTVSGTVAAPRFSVDVAAMLRRAAEAELERQLRKRLERIIK